MLISENHGFHSFIFLLVYCTFIPGWLVGWFYGISTFVGYLTPNPFLFIFDPALKHYGSLPTINSSPCGAEEFPGGTLVTE